MNGRIIFLNGTSSAGKTTLARALREALPEPFCFYASDQLADSGFRALSDRDGEFDEPRERDKFFDGFHRSIVAFAEAGNDMVVEHIVEQQGWADQLQGLLAHLDVFWVGVHVPIGEAERRERERGDRTIGEARYHLKTHGFCTYDIEVQSTDPIDKTTARIMAAWRARSALGRQPA